MPQSNPAPSAHTDSNGNGGTTGLLIRMTERFGFPTVIIFCVMMWIQFSLWPAADGWISSLVDAHHSLIDTIEQDLHAREQALESIGGKVLNELQSTEARQLDMLSRQLNITERLESLIKEEEENNKKLIELLENDR